MNDRRSRPRRCTHSAAAVHTAVSARRGTATDVTSRRGAGELLVDDLLELLEGLGAGDHATVDEECRGAGDADSGRVGHVLVDRVLAGMLGEALVEFRLVETDLARDRLQLGLAQVGRGEDLVVK